MSAVAADFLVLTTLIIAVTLLVVTVPSTSSDHDGERIAAYAKARAELSNWTAAASCNFRQPQLPPRTPQPAASYPRNRPTTF